MLDWIIPLIVLLGAIWIVYIVRNMQKEKDEIKIIHQIKINEINYLPTSINS